MSLLRIETFESFPLGAIPDSWDSTHNLFFGIQQKASGRVQCVASPVLDGTKAAEVTVQPGDNNVAGSGTNGERCEFCCGMSMSYTDAVGTNISPSGEFWYAWSTLFPNGWTASSGTAWNIFNQIHQGGGGALSTGQAPHHFEVDTTTSPHSIELRSYGGNTPSGNETIFDLLPSFSLNTVYRFIFGVKYRADSTGWMEVWISTAGADYVNVLPRTFKPTLYQDTSVYWKAGLYRFQNSVSATIIHDHFRVASSFADLATATPPPPAPAPVVSTPANTGTWTINLGIDARAIPTGTTPAHTGNWTANASIDATTPSLPDPDIPPASTETTSLVLVPVTTETVSLIPG